MFTFFKRSSSSSKHKCEDSRSASGTPPPCSSRLPSPSLLLTTAAGGGGSGERKAPKNKRVRFKFVSDHEEDESRQQRFEKTVSASRSNQLHGHSVDSAAYPHPIISVEEPLSPVAEERHIHSSFEVVNDQYDGVTEETCQRKPRSALNQLLDRMGGKKNRYRGNAGGGNSKKPKHHSEPQKRFNSAVVDHKPENVEQVKKCDQYYEENDFYYDRHGEDGECVADNDSVDGVCETTEVGAGKATPLHFNARVDLNENRPVENIKLEKRDEEHSSWISQKEQQHLPSSVEKHQSRLFVNEQPTIADECPKAAAAGDDINENPAADFVRDLVLNRYKKKKNRPVNQRVCENEIPTVIEFDEHTVPVVIEKSDDEEEKLRMGQPNSKANSPNPLEKSSSDGSIHPTVIITEEEVFYEASGEPESVRGVIPVQDEVLQDDGILRVHSPLTIGGAFKTIHVSTEDLQDELEKEESETEDSGNYLTNSCYQNTIKNKSGVTVTEIVDEEPQTDDCSSNDEDSGCEEILGSVSPQPRPSPVPVVLLNNSNDNSETDEDEDDQSTLRKKLKMESESVTSLPDVVESIGLPNVVHVLHHNASVKFNLTEPVREEKKMPTSQNGVQGVLHVDGNSQRSSLVRNIPITILEEASDEEEEEEKDEEAVVQVDSELFKGNKNGSHRRVPSGSRQTKNNKNYKKTNGFSIHEDTHEELQPNGFDCDKRDLVNQDALQSKGRAAELQSKLNELERTLSVKEWTIDRLQAELASATTEGEGVRRKLKQQEEEMIRCRHKYQDNEEDLTRRFQDLEDRYQQTTEKLTSIQAFTSHLQVQLAEAQSDAETSRAEKEELVRARAEEEKIIRDSLEQAIEERQQVEAKWHREFEQLRNFNQDREEHLMQDCEWRMRTMQKQSKEKLDQAEMLQRELVDITRLQEDKIESLRTLEAEVKGLRGLTGEQRENLTLILRQLEEAKAELGEANERCEEEIRSAQKVKTQCENELLCKERYAQIKIEEAKMQISVQWERKLMEEMLRLKSELEAVHAEDRKDALEQLKEEYTGEINELVKAHKALEKSLNEEIQRLKEILEVKKEELQQAAKNSDKQVVDTRIYVERSDRQNQLMLDREIRNREELIEQMEKDRERDREEMEEQFRERLQSVKDEFARELVESTQEVEEKYKRMIETQLDLFVAEKEEQLQTAETRHRHKIQTMEEEMRALEVQFQREKSDYERNHNIERTSMAKREMQNSQEIDTLHRKCRCLTKLFEEMRMRYERRESRQEDQREISELKERCESQERDLARLTETLRQLQIIQEHQQTPPGQDATMPMDPLGRRILASPGHNCDVIYEEQEPLEEEEEDEEKSTATSIDETEESSTTTSAVLLVAP